MVKRLWPLVFLCVFLIAGCGGTEEKAHRRNFFAMDTYMTMTAYGGTEAEQGLALAERKIRALESALSVTETGSDVYLLNHREGGEVLLGKDAAAVLRAMLGVAADTGGALDPSICPVVTAWGFTSGQPHVPDAESLAESLKKTGWEKIRMEGNTAVLPEGMEIDLGAAGKGYAGREVGRLLRGAGVRSAILSLGGNIEAVGTKPDGSPWQVGLKAPDADGYAGMLSAENEAVVTSGSYERYFTDEDGRRYHHILDPATGYPAENGLLSVTVIGKDGLLCDALSTALFVMGPEKAAEFWRRHSGFEMILITAGREILATEGAAARFEAEKRYTEKPVEVIRR